MFIPKKQWYLRSLSVFHDSEWEIVNSNIIIKKFRLLEDLFVLQTS